MHTSDSELVKHAFSGLKQKRKLVMERQKNMIATHIVTDEDDSEVGFIVEGKFYTDYQIIKNIEYINNLSLTDDGIISPKTELPRTDYDTSVNKKAYARLNAENAFARDVQEELYKWKNDKSHKVLQLEGSRQIGKTTELKKFAYCNYYYTIFVDLSDDKLLSLFLDVVDNGCSPLEMEKYCQKAQLPHFKNNKSTVLIIDEIQISGKIYNSIRKLNDELDCDIIVTGSYLGRILGDKSFFLPAGTISYAYMFTMSFREFCRAFGCEELLDTIDLYGADNDEKYSRLEALYDDYIKIGGYPEAVKCFKATKNIQECYSIIRKLLSTFKDESRNYFKTAREVEVFDNVYREALKEMCSEKRGTGKNIIETITSLTKDNTELIVNKNDVANAVIWLRYAGILGTCSLALNGDMRNIIPDRRIYFCDCGIASYLAANSLEDESALRGMISETFVYNELHRLFKVPYSERRVLEDEVCFSTYNDYELDFMLADKNRTVYGIEVKSKSGDYKSLKVYIERHFIDKGIAVKPTKGGRGERIDTIPIYAAGCRFPYN